MTFDIILFTDATGLFYKQKTLGAWHIASMLRRQNYRVLVIDNFSRYIRNTEKLKEILDIAMSADTKLIGISSTFFTENLPETRSYDNWIGYYGLDTANFYCGADSEQVRNFFDTIRSYNDDVKFLYGGMLATHYEELIKTSPELDYVVVGMGESQVQNVVDSIYKNDLLQYVLASDNKTKILNYDTTAKTFDFHNHGVIRYEPYDVILPGECLSLQTSRGCMFNCAFCSFPMRGRKRDKIDYHLRWDNLENYFRYNYDTYGVTRYQIVDDTFNETTDKLKSFVRVIENSNVPVEWFSFMRVDLLDDEQIDIISDSSCASIWLGVETLNPKALKAIDKKYDPQQALNTIEKINKKSEISVYTSLLFGLKNDTEHDIRTWMKELIDSSVSCMGINPVGTHDRTPWLSSINSNPNKYGYDFNVRSGLNLKELNWTNNTWKGDEAAFLAKEFQDMLFHTKRNLVSSFELMGLPFHGYNLNDLKKTAIKDLPFEKILEDYVNKFDLYHQQMRIELEKTQ